MGAVSPMHISIWAIVTQLLFIAFWLLVIVSIVMLVVNSYKQRKSSENMEALLKEISDKLKMKDN